jgi:hypothetical protein
MIEDESASREDVQTRRRVIEPNKNKNKNQKALAGPCSRSRVAADHASSLPF